MRPSGAARNSIMGRTGAGLPHLSMPVNLAKPLDTIMKDEGCL
ncbi:hypothetical protein GL4_1850 [Methyloceanibacter caenitepidi]|uniref:Uncharacterized protein n=1 Tax=Methyloceanibacter caenitepidi TaxID=1384459 RepID=A0A0A8K454_9HYPH|nr:hypothetical protein GL4_1850 [Methyloceanibacter caenitepidi]